eukprot:scaffold5833_cov165-Amphora_coffeaeformis.AAC.12
MVWCVERRQIGMVHTVIKGNDVVGTARRNKHKGEFSQCIVGGRRNNASDVAIEGALSSISTISSYSSTRKGDSAKSLKRLSNSWSLKSRSTLSSLDRYDSRGTWRRRLRRKRRIRGFAVSTEKVALL